MNVFGSQREGDERDTTGSRHHPLQASMNQAACLEEEKEENPLLDDVHII